ncbi:MAG: phosphohistidine phosphatase SixA [Planctomycetota bacterium]
MELFVIRHAKAADPEEALPDAARPLTTAGIRRFKRIASGLDELEVRFDLVLHSPWRRAVETAELLAELCPGELRVDELLSRPPSRSLFATLEDLADQGNERIGLVGHQPWLGEFVAWCLTGATNAASNLPLRKGGVIWLEGDPRPGGFELRAALPPDVLADLG